MVAFIHDRPQSTPALPAGRSPVDGEMEEMEAHDTASQNLHQGAISHRAARGVEIRRTADGSIAGIRIGRWRTLTSHPERRLAEVRELSCDRVAVRIERLVDGGQAPSSEVWHLYDLEGRLNAALQTVPDGRFAMMANYQTRQACRLAANTQGELQAVEAWAI